MIILPQVSGNAPVTCLYLGNAALGPTTTATFTFTGVSLGPLNPTRLTVIGLAGLSFQVAGVTVGGIPATRIVSDGAPDGTSTTRAELWAVSAPDLDAASVVVTHGVSGTQRVSITVWALYNLIRQSPIASVFSAASPGTLSLAARPRGAVVALAVNNNVSSAFTWSAGEDFQTAAIVPRSAAHIVPTTAAPSLTVSYAPATSPKAVAASFR